MLAPPARRVLDTSVGSRGGHFAPRSPARNPSAAAQLAGSIGAELAALREGEALLHGLVDQPEYRVDEERLLTTLSGAYARAQELKKSPPVDQKAFEEGKRLAQAVLQLCYSWFRLAAAGGLTEGSDGLRGASGAELACGSVVAIVGADTRLSALLLPSFHESGSLGLFGRATCSMDETVLVSSVRKLRQVSGRCGAQARRDNSQGALASLADNVEAFRGSLFARLRGIASRENRRLRVGNFKELVGELGGVLSCVYDTTQVFEMGCLLSMQLTTELACHCPGVPESDALEAVEWMASVLRNLLDQTSSSGALASPVAVREWLEDSGLWSTLLRRAGSRTQHHAHHLVSVLLTRRALAPCDLVAALASAGALSPALSPSLVPTPTPSRLAIQGALLAAVPSLGAEAVLDLFGELCGALGFAHLSEEGIDLLVRLSLRAFAAGYDPVASLDAGLGRSLALSHLLRYLQWGYRQIEPPEQLLECARRALLHTLAPQPALAPLLPALAAEALALAAAPSVGSPDYCLGRCVRSLGMLAVAVASANAATIRGDTDVASRLCEEATAKLCAVLPPINGSVEPPFGPQEGQAWTEAFVDALSCYLRLPSAYINTNQVGVLWSRFIIRPMFGLSTTSAAMQYFKLAFLASSSVVGTLLSPLNASPNQLPEVRLAYASIFCPASFQDDPPPLPMAFFFPEVSVPPPQPIEGGLSMDLSPGDATSPPRLPQPLRRSISSAMEYDSPEFLGESGGLDEVSVEAAAAAADLPLPDTSAMAPRLRLDRVQQAVMHEQSAALFGELTVYDAIERRLWDEFDERGRVDDQDALRQRDAAAQRCLAALDQEIDGAGYAGHELAPPLTEARAKFSALCKLVTGRAAELTGQEVQEAEFAFAEAEENLVVASTAQRRATGRSRRRGVPPPPPADVAAARSSLSRAHVALVAALRRVAMRAQLGLVEVIGVEGLGRALRAVGKGHGDPLLENLPRHERWAAAQATGDAKLGDLRAGATSSPSMAALAAPPALDDAALARPEGLLGYSDLRELARGSVLSARRRGLPVALKAHAESHETCYQRELAGLRSLQSPFVVPLQGAFHSGNSFYLELGWCAGGTLSRWCEEHPGVVGTEDVESFVKCLGIFRQVWQAVAYLHSCGAVHGDMTLGNVLLTADHRPLLADFKRCVLGSNASQWRGGPQATADYVAPELEDHASGSPIPTQPADVYSTGVMMAKAFLGPSLWVSSCPYHPTRGQRCLPDERTDVDLADLMQLTLAQEPSVRPAASTATVHRALDPAHFLRRRGLLGNASTRGRAPAEVLLSRAEHLFQEYRGRRVDEPLMFARDSVFDAIATSRVGEWSEEALLGEWRVMLSDESGVDGGGLRREVVSLFFEQFEQSSLVMRAGGDGLDAQPTFFVGDRQKADRSPQQWRQMWSAVGAMILRAVVHFGNAPVAFSSAVFDCAFGRIGRLPPDDLDSLDLPDGRGGLAGLREQRGDEWARSELLDLLRRLRQADAQKEAGYRWMLAQRSAEMAGGAGWSAMTADAVDTIGAMLEQQAYQFLMQNGEVGTDGSITHEGAVLEWALLWDIYLKYLGGGDRWLAYEALVDGLTARGRCADLWAPLTGSQLAEALEGAPLTPEAVVANLEFKPSYGYDAQIQSFRHVVESFSAEELSMFLRFATGIGRLPANRRFPKGQKLTVRFMPDHLDRLPSAHTCFWVVDLPPYEDQNDMAEKLRQAIAAPQPFALS